MCAAVLVPLGSRAASGPHLASPPASCAPEPPLRLCSRFLAPRGPFSGREQWETPAGASSSRHPEGRGRPRRERGARLCAPAGFPPPPGPGQRRDLLGHLPERVVGSARITDPSPPAAPPPPPAGISAGLGGQKTLAMAFRVALVPGLGQASAAFRPPPPASRFSRVRPSPPTRFLLLPTTLFSWMCPCVPCRAGFFLQISPPTPLLPREASNQKQNNREEGREGKKSCARVACLFTALIPFDVQGVAPLGVSGRVGGWAGRAPSGWLLPSAGGAREAAEVPQSPPGAPRSRRSPHPKPAQAAAPKCSLAALKQNPEGASFLPTSPGRALLAGRRRPEMNGPGPGWECRPPPHPPRRLESAPELITPSPYPCIYRQVNRSKRLPIQSVLLRLPFGI